MMAQPMAKKASCMSALRSYEPVSVGTDEANSLLSTTHLCTPNPLPTSLGQQRPDMCRVIPSVSLRLKRTLARPASLALDSRYGIHQLKGLGDIVSVRASQPDRQWNALGIGYDMMLATRLRPVRGVGACFLPPKTARTEALSSTARVRLCAQLLAGAQGIPSGSQTPDWCQSLRRLPGHPTATPSPWVGLPSQCLSLARTVSHLGCQVSWAFLLSASVVVAAVKVAPVPEFIAYKGLRH